MSNMDTLMAIYAAFGRRDFAGILGQCTDDVEWDTDAPSYGVPLFEPRVGKAEVEKFFPTLGLIESSGAPPNNFLEGGNEIAVTFNVKLKVKATGKPVEALEIHLWTFNDDHQVTKFFHSVDRQAFALAFEA